MGRAGGPATAEHALRRAPDDAFDPLRPGRPLMQSLGLGPVTNGAGTHDSLAEVRRRGRSDGRAESIHCRVSVRRCRADATWVPRRAAFAARSATSGRVPIVSIRIEISGRGEVRWKRSTPLRHSRAMLCSTRSHHRPVFLIELARREMSALPSTPPCATTMDGLSLAAYFMTMLEPLRGPITTRKRTGAVFSQWLCALPCPHPDRPSRWRARRSSFHPYSDFSFMTGQLADGIVQGDASGARCARAAVGTRPRPFLHDGT